MTSELKDKYTREVAPTLMREFGYKNVMQVPKVHKVVVNVGVGEAIQNAKALEATTGDIAAITGQHPVITRAKKSISTFKLRAGMPVGVTVTMRGDRMYDFLNKLMNVALPRLRDFSGVSDKAFDGRGNYCLGLREQLIFPEMEYDKIDKLRGLEVCVVTTARTDEEAKRLLELLGMAFQH